jgi:ADP-ribose pyrophosphatase YjhB (NUDIX family)
MWLTGGMTLDPAVFLRWRASLEAIARTGIAFTPNVYDRERFEEILAIALEMNEGESLFPHDSETVIDLRDDNDASIASRYVTPKVGVSVAIHDDEGRLLLIERAASKTWCLVAGYADVGYSAAEVAIKEAQEEVGLDIEVLDLLGVSDNMQIPSQRTTQYGVLLSGRVTGGELRLAPMECSDARWVRRDDLPEPLHGGGVNWIEEALASAEGHVVRPFFDAPRPERIAHTSRSAD